MAPKLHYSGNFFWANSHYVKTLVREIGPDYLDPGILHCSNSNSSKHFCFKQSNIALPLFQFDPEVNYILLDIDMVVYQMRSTQTKDSLYPVHPDMGVWL